MPSRPVQQLIRSPECPQSGLRGERHPPCVLSAASPSRPVGPARRSSALPLGVAFPRTNQVRIPSSIRTCDLRPRVCLRERQSRAGHTALFIQIPHSHPFARPPSATLHKLRIGSRMVAFAEPPSCSSSKLPYVARRHLRPRWTALCRHHHRPRASHTPARREAPILRVAPRQTRGGPEGTGDQRLAPREEARPHSRLQVSLPRTE